MPHLGELDPRLAVLAPVAPTVGLSPWVYTAGSKGMLTINGGTVSLVSYARGITFALMPVSGGVMMMQGDTVTITFILTPSVNFFPW